MEREAEPKRQPATEEELAQYAEREQSAQKQEKFEGGRMRNSDLITIILVLLIVVLVIAIV